MKELVLDIAKALVDNPDAVVVEEIKAIRTVVRSAANREKVKVSLEIV